MSKAGRICRWRDVNQRPVVRHFHYKSMGNISMSIIPCMHNRPRRGSRISARGGRQGNDDLIWDGNERFLTYANTDLQLFKMFIAISCLNGVEQPFKRHQCPFFLPLRRGNPRLRRGSFRPRGGRPPQLSVAPGGPGPLGPSPWVRPWPSIK